MRTKLREALIQTILELRPSWRQDEDGLRKALDHPDLPADENRTVLAAIRAATDGNVRSPGVIPKPGPHWDEKPANPPTQLPRYVDPFNRAPVSEEQREDTYRRGAALAKTALLSARDSAFCHHCSTSMPRQDVANHDCGRNK